ncbi:hypothetical protein CDEST_14479 [Colletotrichum destructivum]|uniref:Uncharacterized protein n=1 Tax=Colletotrichum destructivum TaxID=34406 RepID=A0AAX4J2A4_9PEZI|nr:hypothetical protein CDEST_14479 [Colletotrichum destructivum]
MVVAHLLNFFSIRIKVQLDAPPSFCLPSLLYQLPGAKSCPPRRSCSLNSTRYVRILTAPGFVSLWNDENNLRLISLGGPLSPERLYRLNI